MELHALVTISREVAATRSRTRKVTSLGEALSLLEADELDAGIAYLSGEPRQPRLELGPAAVHGVRPTPARAPTLTVAEVDAALQRIADVAVGTGSRTRRVDHLTKLLARATADEQTWLRGLVLRELRQGALEGLMVQAIARAADVEEHQVRRAVMVTGELHATAAAALQAGAGALADLRLQVGVPLQPMLAASAPDIDRALEGLEEAVIEAKLDGARVQVHRDGDQVRVYTRNLREITARAPEIVAAARRLPARAAVLDGEALTFGPDGRPAAFQETMERFGRDHTEAGVAASRVLHVRFFDLLHLDGEDLLDLPLHERLIRLADLVPAELRTDQLVTGQRSAADEFLQRTLAAGHEGVMVKDPDRPYEAGRRGASWRKVKPVHTLDLVVLAAEWGSGRRRGWLSNLHLGAHADDADRAGQAGTDGFVMLGKTFKGLTDEVLGWQTEQLLARKRARQGHVVHVRPELVVEIALDGVVRSPRYPGGLALRFARVRGYRPDKDPAEADTIETIRAIHEGRRLPAG